jgi:F-box and leucine-rich repeat protein 2/20
MLSLVAHFAKFKKMKRLELEGGEINDDICEQIATKCPQLQHLVLTDTNMSDSGVSTIVQKLQHLKSLDISLCKNITDNSITTIAESCKHLTSLCVRDTEITDKGLSTLASSSLCQKTVSSIDLKYCNNITDNGVREIVMNFPHLQRLILSNCNGLTEGLFSDPPWKCKKLTELDISYLNVGSSAIFFISNSMNSLVTLDLYNIKGDVSESAIMSLANLPKLKKLKLHGLEVVNIKLVHKIIERFSLSQLYINNGIIPDDFLYYTEFCEDADISYYILKLDRLKLDILNPE